MPTLSTYLFLIAAITAEVVATIALTRSESFTRLYPSLITIVGYALAFWLLSFPLRVMPTGIVYAIWSGLGIVLIAGISWIWFDQKLDLPALVGLSFILTGVLIVNLWSNTLAH
jgi:small multidrug resistance pump